ncbi:MAG: ABC transporter substrate-binding protein [Actinomycetota bacterium]|jgi:ABC-type branched-subunit amino acid transport system substrate-binding protein|nr:ABC transporter substrate-binding protein [Actinomycetota bacterium]
MSVRRQHGAGATAEGRPARSRVRAIVLGLTALSLPLAACSTTSSSSAGSSAKPTTASAGPSCQKPVPVTAAMDASTTGITADSVTVGNVATISGPVPGLFEGAPIGVKAYFDYVNSQGGVNGRKLEVKSMDDAFTGQQNASETQTAVSSDFAMVGNFSLFDSYGCKILAQNPAVADVSVTLDPGTNALPNDFSAQPLALGLALGSLQYIRKKYPSDRRVGTIVSTTASAVAQWQGEEAALEHAGFTIAYQQKVEPLTSDFTTEVIKMRDAGVNVLYLTALDWQVAALITKDMVEQDWHPAVVLSGGPIYADQFIAAAGGASAVDGDWIGQAQALYLGQDASSVPADKLFLQWVKTVTPKWTPDLFTLYGWSSAQLFVQALRAAGKDPTRGSLLAQLHKITSFDASGLLAPTDPANKLPSNCFVMARIEHGQFQRVLPPKSGFTCSSTFYYASGKP